MSKPQRIISTGMAACTVAHYNEDIDVDMTYRFEHRKLYNGNQFVRVYYTGKDWGREEYHKQFAVETACFSWQRKPLYLQNNG